ncbi:hypothetical protein AYI68_g5655, partial [Smittium mucronatum]
MVMGDVRPFAPSSSARADVTVPHQI